MSPTTSHSARPVPIKTVQHPPTPSTSTAAAAHDDNNFIRSVGSNREVTWHKKYLARNAKERDRTRKIIGIIHAAWPDTPYRKWLDKRHLPTNLPSRARDLDIKWLENIAVLAFNTSHASSRAQRFQHDILVQRGYPTGKLRLRHLAEATGLALRENYLIGEEGRRLARRDDYLRARAAGSRAMDGQERRARDHTVPRTPASSRPSSTHTTTPRLTAGLSSLRTLSSILTGDQGTPSRRGRDERAIRGRMLALMVEEEDDDVDDDITMLAGRMRRSSIEEESRPLLAARAPRVVDGFTMAMAGQSNEDVFVEEDSDEDRADEDYVDGLEHRGPTLHGKGLPGEDDSSEEDEEEGEVEDDDETGDENTSNEKAREETDEKSLFVPE